MIIQLFWGTLMALWLGILTSISPCPMATNLAAVSFIGKRVGETHRVLLTGAFYTLGRMLAYIILGILVSSCLLSMPILAHWLQKYMNKLLGPFMLVVGLFLLNVFRIKTRGSRLSQWAQKNATSATFGMATLLGVLFAISFCPISAALFFGSLIPIAVENQSLVVVPTVYGIGTALPVLASSAVLAYSVNSLGTFFDKITRFEFLARRVTGIIFLGLGAYFTWTLTY